MITYEQALTGRVFITKTGRRWRRNGKTQTWKTRPGEFRIPVKHGLYEYGEITHEQAENFSVEGA